MNIWLIVGLILAVAVLFFAVRVWLSYRFLWKVQQDSLIVFGKRGHGKTLLFSVLSKQWAKRSKARAYVSNTDFKHNGGELVRPSVVNVGANSWEDVLTGNVKPIDPQPLEGKAVYLDDAGVYLPNFADNMLKRQYPSMPIGNSVWRHLYNAPIHLNCQASDRAWKIMREQADGYLKARRVTKIGPFFRIACTYYEKARSAEEDLAPIKKRLFRAKGESDVYNASNGLIKDFAIWGVCCHHKYDSRYFRSVFFKSSPSAVNESEKSNGER